MNQNQFMDELFKKLKILTELPGPVGREKIVQQHMEKSFSNFTDDVSSDGVGNLVAHFPGKGVKTVVAAHACEIGFMVNEITENGFLKILPNYKTRDPDTRILPFKECLVLNDNYENFSGFFALETGHTLDTKTRKKRPKLSDICVDLGLSSEKEVKELGIDVGSPVLWKVTTEKIGNFVKGKAMDDRCGLTILLELAEFLSKSESRRDVYLISTVQEEIGVRGAEAVALQEKFEEAYILEIGPGLNLGEGPGVIYKDAAIHYHHDLLMKVKSVAEIMNLNLPFNLTKRNMY